MWPVVTIHVIHSHSTMHMGQCVLKVWKCKKILWTKCAGTIPQKSSDAGNEQNRQLPSVVIQAIDCKLRHVSLMFLEYICKMVGLLTCNRPQLCLLKQLWKSTSASICWGTLSDWRQCKSKWHLPLRTNHCIALDCHYIGRPFQRIPSSSAALGQQQPEVTKQAYCPWLVSDSWIAVMLIIASLKTELRKPLVQRVKIVKKNR